MGGVTDVRAGCLTSDGTELREGVSGGAVVVAGCVPRSGTECIATRDRGSAWGAKDNGQWTMDNGQVKDEEGDGYA